MITRGLVLAVLGLGLVGPRAVVAPDLGLHRFTLVTRLGFLVVCLLLCPQ